MDFQNQLPIIGSADFNSDGKPDILTAYNPNIHNDGSGLASYALLLNQGDGTFALDVLTNVVVPTDPTIPTSALIADVNGDGKPDLIILNNAPLVTVGPTGPATLYVYLGNGNGTFTPLAPQVIFSNMAARVTAAADLNGDGKADILVDSVSLFDSLGYDQTPIASTIFLNNGKGVFAPGPALPAGITTVQSPGDYYGHGFIDLVGGGHFLKNDGKANFTIGAALPLAGTINGVGDLNHDGLNDVIIDSTVFINQGNGSFRKTAVLPAYVDPGYIVDVNHDGKPDFIAGGGGLQVYLGNGDGTFGFPTVYSTGFYIVASDFNGDGNLDILATSHDAPFLLSLGDAHGNFPLPRVTTTTAYPAGALSIATGDFNGDKKPDIAVFNQGACTTLPGSGQQPVVCPPGNVAVSAGTGLGYLEAPHYFSVGVPAGVMAVGDVNGDGKLDIVVTRAAIAPPGQTSSVPYDTSVLLGKGDGTFAKAMNFHLLGYPDPNAPTPTATDGAIFLLDVNHDGKLDLVGDWGVALGNGDGTFKAPIALPSGLQTITGLTVGDFNRDGNLDLEVASSGQLFGTAFLNTLLGDGKGSFTIAHVVPLTARNFLGGISAITAADVNGDGIPDLIYTANSFTDNGANFDVGLNVQFGNGDGTFAAAATYPCLGGLNIYTSDFNRDGLTDVLISSLNSQVLFKGTGKGTFSSPPQYLYTRIYSTSPAPLAVVNLNADNAPDVAGVLYYEGIVRIINTAVH